MEKTPYPIRPEVQSFEPYSPGRSIDEVRARYGLENVVKMASNENPLGVSPLVQKVLRDNAGLAFRYPQSGNPGLVRAIAAHHGIDGAHIVPGNGSDEVIDLLIRVTATPGVHNIVACKPSFNMYRVQSRLCGVEFRAVPLMGDSTFDWEGLDEAIDACTAIVFITTPDNPSGYCPTLRQLASFARRLPESCLLVVDEAYMDFAGEGLSLLPHFAEYPNLVILRTFSKSYGLAGLRLGYGIMPGALAEYLRRVHMPFSVNILAELAGIAALEDRVFYESTLRCVREGREMLFAALASLGCEVQPSEANFLSFALPIACEKSAMDVFEELMSKGLIIRPLVSYGLPRHLRVSIGSEEENRLFLRLIRESLA